MESQCGFRRGRGTIDNVFILNHLTQREKNGSTDEIYAVFVDLKAAFDNVDRELLWDSLEKNRISEGLIRKLKKMHEEMVAAVRTEEGISEIFSSRKGVRQGCVLSPLLFNLYIADINVFMRNKGIEGVKLRKEKIWTLAYADDLVLIAKNKEAMLDMLGTLRGFFKDRRLNAIKLNAKKTKVLVFNKKDREKKNRKMEMEIRYVRRGDKF